MYLNIHSEQYLSLGREEEGSDGGLREVRYTDQEYEDDSSEDDDDYVLTKVPFLPTSGMLSLLYTVTNHDSLMQGARWRQFPKHLKRSKFSWDCHFHPFQPSIFVHMPL